MKAQSPLLGFNNNVRHKGRVFHIQTEDSGVKHPHVITHLFADGGRIVKSQKTSYAEYVGDEEMSRKVRALMQEQHKGMFIALRAGKFDHLLEGVPVAEPPPEKRGRAPMESTVSIEIGNESEPGGVVHIAPGEQPPQRPAAPAPAEAPESVDAPSTDRSPAPDEIPAPPPAPKVEPQKPEPKEAARAVEEPSSGLRKLTPPPPPPPNRQSPPARPASIIPPAARPLAPPSVPPPPLGDRDAGLRPGMTEALRQQPRRNSGLLAALGALSSGNKAPSLGAAPPSARPASSLGAGSRQRNELPANPATAATQPRLPAPSSLDLDLEALERAAEQGNSPVYRQVRDFPPPPQAVRSTGNNPGLRSLTPAAGPATIPQPASQPASQQGGRYAPSRPASIFGNAKPQEGSSIFGEDLISEKSLDEVILSYLAEDLDAPPKK